MEFYRYSACQVIEEGVHVGVSFLGAFCQASHDDAFESWGNIFYEIAEGSWFRSFIGLVTEGLLFGIPREWETSAAELVGHDSESEDIGCLQGDFRAELFGRHVSRSADSTGTSGLFDRAGQVEIRQLDHWVNAVGGIHQKVFRLDIQVEDLILMHVSQAFGCGNQEFLAVYANRFVPSVDQYPEVAPRHLFDDFIGLEPAAAHLEGIGQIGMRREARPDFKPPDETCPDAEPEDITASKFPKDGRLPVAGDDRIQQSHAAFGKWTLSAI